MIKRVIVFLVALGIFLSFPILATKVEQTTTDATHILIGKVKKVDCYYGTNEWGDTLIYSRVEVKVMRKLKGKAEDLVSFVVEGGTVGEITLKVSEYPLFTEGEKIKLYLKKTDHIFKFVRSEVLEEAPASAKKPGGKPGAPTCCKTFAHWPYPYDVVYHIFPSSNDGLSDDCIVNEVNASADIWNSVSAINMNYVAEGGVGNIEQNYSNDIIFRPASSGSTIAVTYIWYSRKGKEIFEFDMLFYDGAWIFFSLICDPPNSCDTGFYIQPIATHELGHAIGLDHNRCQTSIMYPYASYCETNSLSADDVACVSNLYK